MNRKRTLVAICIFFLLVSLSANIAAAGGAPAIDRYVIGGGGGLSTAGTYTLNGTVGQPIAGIKGAGTFQICAGFWCLTLPAYSIDLPLIQR